jgi:GNAT superfamily N-acetyltransferase
MYEVDREASADIPGLASSHDQTFEEWRSFAIERPSRDLDLTLLALADGEVVGVAYLEQEGFHNLTGVRRDWRGRGVASALKRAQIAGAHARGMKRLVTESQHENVPMRRLNEKLGYKPTIASIVYQGPLLG